LGAAVGPPDFIASYWTLAGPVLPRSASQVSPFAFEDRARAAAAAGYRGIGLMHDDLRAVVHRLGFAAMRALLRDHGLVHLELEFLTDWFADGERKARSDALASELLQAAAALGARHVKVGGDRFGADWPPAQLADGFATLCERAAAHGTRIALELLPWTGLATPAQGRALLQAAGSPRNGGLLLDVWHLQRVGVPWREVAALPASAIAGVELDDADAQLQGSLWEDTIHRRRLCGQGGFDLAGFLRAVQAAGYEGPWGIEIISDEHRARTLHDAAMAAIASARPLFTTA
jgi:sugar phosphate isomerase/epimerase